MSALRDLELFGLQSTPLGLREILRSAPCQVKMPTDLLDWGRQFYIEGLKSGLPSWRIEVIIRVVAIKAYYSPLQIQAAIDRVKMELQNQPAKVITKKLYN